MHDACDATGPIAVPRCDDDRGDLALFHDIERVGRELRPGNGHRIASHDVTRGQAENVGAPLHAAAQVAVGDDAEQLGIFHSISLAPDDAGHAETLAGHFIDHVTHRSVGAYDRTFLAAVHQHLDAHQPLSEFA